MKAMKKIVALALVAMLAGAVTTPISASAETAEDIGNGWTITYQDGYEKSDENYAVYTNEESRSGDWSLKVRSSASMTGEFNRIVISHPAKDTWGSNWDETDKYTVEFYAKGFGDNNDLKWGFRAGTFNSPVDTINGTCVPLTASKVTWGEEDENGWAKVSFDFAYPYNTNTDFKFEVRSTGDADAVYFDDVSVIYTGTHGQTNTVLLTEDEGNFEPKPVATGEDIADYGWSVKSVADGYTLTTDIVEEHGGNKMLHVTYNGGWNKSIILRDIATPAGAGGIDWSPYRVYFDMKGTVKLGSMEVGCESYDNHIRFLSNTDYVTTKDLGDGWTQYAVTTAGKNEGGNFRIQLYGPTDIYLDNFMVVKLDSDGNEVAGDHLHNGSFDNPAAAASDSPKNWRPQLGTASTDVYLATVDGTHTYTGDNAYFISGSNTWISQASADARQTLPANFDYTKSYTFKAKVYTPCPETGLLALFTNVSGSATAQFGLNSATATVTDLGNGWYEYSAPMQAAEGYNHLAIRSSGMVGGNWIDDVSLTDENGVNYVKNGSFEEFEVAEFGELTLMDDAYETINAPVAGENNASVYIKTLKAGQNYQLLLAIYKDGALYDVAYTESLNTEVGEQELVAGITLDTVDDGVYTAKAFLWNGGMAPHMEAVEFPAAE